MASLDKYESWSCGGGTYEVRFHFDSTTVIEDNCSDIYAYARFTLKSGIGMKKSKTVYSFYFDGELIGTTSKTFNTYDANSTVGSKTFLLPHKGDGTLSGYLEIVVEIPGYSSYRIGSQITCDPIPREPSTIDATPGYVEGNMIIAVNAASSSYTHTITYQFGSLSGTIASNTTKTMHTWSVPSTFYNQMPNDTIKYGTLTCTTYSGSTTVGTHSIDMEIRVNQDKCTPTLSPTVYDNNSATVNITGDSSKFIKFHSIPRYDSGAAARNGASLISLSVSCGKYEASAVSGTLPSIENDTFTFTAIDSRGYITSKTITVNLIPYIKFTCNLKVNPIDKTNVALNISGNCYTDAINGKNNNISIALSYKTIGAASWTSGGTLTPTIGQGVYSITHPFTVVNRQTYTVKLVATDWFNNIVVEQIVKINPIFDIGQNDFNFNVPVTITEDGVGDSFDVLAAVKNANKLYNALTTPYTLECSAIKGTNYTSFTANATLVGNTLRIGINATRAAATGVGDITNEVVGTLYISHGGKIKSMEYNSFSTGSTGGIATLEPSNLAYTSTDEFKFDVVLAATGTAMSNFSSYFIIPVAIELEAYPSTL